MERKSLLLKSEHEVNVIVSKILIWSLLVFPICMILSKSFIGLFPDEYQIFLLPGLLATIFNFLPYLFRKFHLNSTVIKYTAIIAGVISIGIVNSTGNMSISIILLYPVALSLLYFDKKLTVFAIIINFFNIGISQYLCDLVTFQHNGMVRFGTSSFWEGYIVNISIYFIEVTILALIFIMLTKRTRNLLETMSDIVNALSEDAQQVATTSVQLSSSARKLSQRSAEQASAIEETSSTLLESSTMLQQNTANTKQAAKLSEQAKDSANKGSNEMEEMMSSIQEIKKSSDQISKIIKVIDDIAFQTNILALNAAVEAARAGESGVGFAVVAEEIRNLAQRSAQAAEDTTTIIESNIKLSGHGVFVAEKVREALLEITTYTKKVNELMDEVAAASVEQSQGVEQITKTLSQMETITQENAANAEESASIAEKLNAQADNMRKIVQGAFGISNEEASIHS